jgi:4-amino-4-deoxy-L-arabinose transferase-like glycosyltransferase
VKALLRPTPILLFVVLAVPWFVVVSLRNPEFPQFFFIHEHFERFTAEEGVGHPNGPFYYIPALLGGPMPWSLLVVLLLLRRAGRDAAKSVASEPRDFLALWAGIVIAFFTVASSKLPSYILPAYPALALLTGAFFDRVVDEERLVRGPLDAVAWLFGGLAAIGIVAGIGSLVLAPVLAPRFDVEPEGLRDVGISSLALALPLLAASALTLRREMAARFGTVGVLVLLISALEIGLFGGMGVRALAKTSRDLAAAIAAETTPGDQSLVAAYHRLMQSLSFYSQRRVTQVMATSEIEFGLSHAPDRDEYFWEDLTRLQREWASGRKVFVATNDDLVGDLDAALVPKPRLLARDGNRVLVVNFPATAAGARLPEAPGPAQPADG